MKLINKLLILSIASTIVATFSISSAIALTKKGADDVSFGIRQATPTHHVNFYTSFDGGDWIDEVSINVTNGESVSLGDIPSISLSGYSFQGWIEAIPTSSNYSTGVLSSSDISTLAISGNHNYYPILKSDDKVAYTHSNDSDCYYPLNSDVTITYQTLKATYIGYRYVGITGIPDASSSWLNDRDLITESGIYQFYESDGAALVNRKIGFRVSDVSGHWGADTVEYYGLYYFGDGNGWCNTVLERTDNTSPYLGYYYIPINFPSIIFVRLNNTTTSWDNKKNGCQSGNISLIDNKKYNGSDTNSYSSTDYVLDKNQNWDSDGWTGCWSNY